MYTQQSLISENVFMLKASSKFLFILGLKQATNHIISAHISLLTWFHS